MQCHVYNGIYAGDHTAWDRQEIVEMLQIFINITEAFTLPDLKEYYWRNDKVANLLMLVIMPFSAARYDGWKAKKKRIIRKRVAH